MQKLEFGYMQYQLIYLRFYAVEKKKKSCFIC